MQSHSQRDNCSDRAPRPNVSIVLRPRGTARGLSRNYEEPNSGLNQSAGVHVSPGKMLGTPACPTATAIAKHARVPVVWSPRHTAPWCSTGSTGLGERSVRAGPEKVQLPGGRTMATPSEPPGLQVSPVPAWLRASFDLCPEPNSDLTKTQACMRLERAGREPCGSVGRWTAQCGQASRGSGPRVARVHAQKLWSV